MACKKFSVKNLLFNEKESKTLPSRRRWNTVEHSWCLGWQEAVVLANQYCNIGCWSWCCTFSFLLDHLRMVSSHRKKRCCCRLVTIEQSDVHQEGTQNREAFHGHTLLDHYCCRRRWLHWCVDPLGKEKKEINQKVKGNRIKVKWNGNSQDWRATWICNRLCSW